MGLDIWIETEEGKVVSDIVSDPHNFLYGLLPDYQNASYVCLRFVDMYGLTIFNRLQMDSVLRELELLRGKTHHPSELELLEKIISLARACKKEPHLYLKFEGD